MRLAFWYFVSKIDVQFMVCFNQRFICSFFCRMKFVVDVQLWTLVYGRQKKKMTKNVLNCLKSDIFVYRNENDREKEGDKKRPERIVSRPFDKYKSSGSIIDTFSKWKTLWIIYNQFKAENQAIHRLSLSLFLLVLSKVACVFVLVDCNCRSTFWFFVSGSAVLPIRPDQSVYLY